MDEKTTEDSTTLETEPTQEEIETPESSETNAGNVEIGEPEADKAEDILAVKSAEEAVVATDANSETNTLPDQQTTIEGNGVLNEFEASQNIISIDINDIDTTNDVETVENNLNSEDVSSMDETITENATNSENEVQSQSDVKENSENEVISSALNLNDVIANAEDAVDKPNESEEIKLDDAMEVDQSVEKAAKDAIIADYQLEEELKRLHGDTTDDAKSNDVSNNLSVSSTLEEKSDSAVKKADGNVSKPLLQVKKLEEEKPIMKDSDLEEMLSADVVMKDPVLIKEAQNDLKTTDIFICGRCHEVYHFIEEFQNHKSQNCTAKSAIIPICEGESKPQVWGFTLWKTKQNKSLKPGEPVPTSWKTYQNWCKLAPIDKNAWISAGQTIQFIHKMASAKVEVKPKNVHVADKDPLAIDGVENKENSIVDHSKPSNRIVKTVRTEPFSPIVKSVEVNTNKAVKSSSKTQERSEYAVERIIAKRFNSKKKCWEYQIKWEHFPSDQNTWEPLANLTHCKQMVDGFEEQLRKLKADKAKHMNMAAKSRPTSTAPISSNVSNISTTSVDSTPGRPTRSSKQKALNQVKAWCGNISDEDASGAGGSVGAAAGPGGVKRKHPDDDSDDSFEKKIKTEEFSDDSDFDLSSVLNTTSKAPPPLRKIPTVKQQPSPQKQQIQILKNGIDGKSGPLPQNILIPDANGVVRINQKQLPSLSTGVYIMSKTAGIIKLDSNTSKVATSGGQTIVKVAPKIGQTQIKIVKKDGTTTTTTKQIVPRMQATSTPVVKKVYKPIITKVKKPQETIVKKSPEIVVKKPTEPVMKPQEVKKVTPQEVRKEKPTQNAQVTPKPPVKVKEEPKKTLTSMMDMSAPEDSDDGLEELPFPEDIKPPPPESPPGDFVLDPITGKLAGVEYPEKPEPVVEPEPESMEPAEETKSDSSLDNIVKLAAADITEEDLKNDDSMDVDMAQHQEQEEEEEETFLRLPPKKPTTTVVRSVSEQHMGASNVVPRTVVRMPVGASNRTQIKQQRPPGSILNKVLTGTPIIRRTPVTSSTAKSQQQQQQQRILNQSLLKNTYGGGTIVRVGSTTYVRKAIAPKRAKPSPQHQQQHHVLAATSPTTRIIKSQHDPTGKNVYTYSRQVVQQPKRIGNTTIRQAASLDALAQQQKMASSSNVMRIASGGSPMTQTVRRVVQTAGVSPVKKEAMIKQHQEQQRKVVMGAARNPRVVQQQQVVVHHQPVAKPKAVINMPSLLGDDEPETEEHAPELTKSSPPTSSTSFATTVMSTSAGLLEPSAISESLEPLQEPIVEAASNVEQTLSEQQLDATAAAGAATSAEGETAATVNADLSSFTLTDNDNPIFITGDDGTVYQVAGQNEQGQTILLTQGSDGQQQCLLVTSEVAEAMETAAEQQPEQPAPEISVPEINESLTEPLNVKTDPDPSDQVVAQVVRAEPPSPGGTHKVVVMLPDGNLMVTQVSPEEYASLELE